MQTKEPSPEAPGVGFHRLAGAEGEIAKPAATPAVRKNSRRVGEVKVMGSDWFFIVAETPVIQLKGQLNEGPIRGHRQLVFLPSTRQ